MPLEKRITTLGDDRVTTLVDKRAVLESGRAIEQALADAMVAPVVVPFIAIDLLFDSGAVFLWGGIGSFSYNGNTYVGQGTLLEITKVQETRQLKAAGLRVSLSGVAASIVSLVLSEKYSGRVMRLHAGALNSATGNLIGAKQLFQGKMDQMTWDQPEGDDTVKVLLTADHEWKKLEATNDPNYTPESQRLRYPGDTFFDFVAALQDKSIEWQSG